MTNSKILEPLGLSTAAGSSMECDLEVRHNVQLNMQLNVQPRGATQESNARNLK
jgi:hypothetical protein